MIVVAVAYAAPIMSTAPGTVLLLYGFRLFGRVAFNSQVRIVDMDAVLGRRPIADGVVGVCVLLAGAGSEIRPAALPEVISFWPP